MNDANRLSIKIFEEAAPVIAGIRPLLAGRDPMVQSLILADLTSQWLAGHMVLDKDSGALSRVETDQMREEIFQNYIGLVRNLTPVNHDIIMQGRSQEPGDERRDDDASDAFHDPHRSGFPKSG
jgi:hypothetical protein